MNDFDELDLSKPLLTDTLTSIVGLVFAVVSLATYGKASVEFADMRLDRGVVVGFLFFLGSAVPWALPMLFRRRRPIVLRWFRLFYIQIFYLVFFSEAIHLSYLLHDGASYDRFFADLDMALFGMQPSVELYRLLPRTRLVTEFFFFSYAFYFLLFSAGIWLLFFRRREASAYVFLSTVTTGFYLLFLFYLIVPVAGPKYFFDTLRRQWYDPFEGFLFTHLLKRAFDSMDLYGAAFPSSHAAIATVSLLMNFRFQRTVGWVVLPFTLSLLVSTVYIYAHYAVDIIAGVVVGLLFFYLLPPVLRRLGVAHDRVAAAYATPRYGTRKAQ